jgi:thiol-disulfide isomerase/thioredoxin
MKKYLLSLGVIALMAFTSCGGDDAAAPSDPNPELNVADVQNVMVAEVTATWCGPCGQWGKPTITEVAEKYGKRSVKVSFNSSSQGDVLFVQDALAFADFIDIDGYPTQAINLKRVVQTFPASIAQIKQKVYDLSDVEAAKAPEAVVGISFKEDAAAPGSYTIKTRTRFIKDMPEGIYNVGVFIIQDGIIEAQNGNSSTFEHTGVFRKTALNEDESKTTWGTQIATNDAKAGAKFDKTFIVTDPGNTGKLAWVKSKMKAVAVIYKMNAAGTRPESVVNCNIAKVIE